MNKAAALVARDAVVKVLTEISNLRDGLVTPGRMTPKEWSEACDHLVSSITDIARCYKNARASQLVDEMVMSRGIVHLAEALKILLSVGPPPEPDNE